MSTSMLINFLTKFKVEGKENKFRLVKFEFSSGSNKSISLSSSHPSQNFTRNYSVMTNPLEDSRNVRSVWKFNDKILNLKFRPKLQLQIANYRSKYEHDLYEENSHLSISFNNGRLATFHYESKSIIYEYKTNFGNIISLEYSADGRVLGLGTESDNVFILDAEMGSLVYCFEGHRNYVTSIHFEEVINEEDQGIHGPLERQQTILEGDYLNTLNTIETNRNYGSNLYGTNSVINKPPVNKEVNSEEFLRFFVNNQEDTNTPLDLKSLKRTRTQLKNNNLDLEDELRASATYDVFTTGLDGYLGVWRIEHFYEDGHVNENNYTNLPYTRENSQVIKTDPPCILTIQPHENIKVFYADMQKACKCPINKMLIYDNSLAIIGKRNANGSYCFLTFFHHVNKTEEKYKDVININNINNNSNMVNSDDYKSRTPLNTTSSNHLKSDVNSLKNQVNDLSLYETPTKEKRGASITPIKKNAASQKEGNSVGSTNLTPNVVKKNENLAVTPDRRPRSEFKK